MGIAAGVIAPIAGDPFWDPVPFSWPVLLILAGLCLLLTIGFMVWTVLQPDEPEHDTTALVDKATRQDRRTAATIRRRLDADTGRADAAEPELR
ncbi:hypothetical protein CFK39_09700 [Brachybacterium avium]|uniref:Uncharacterized protein n=1 Tax=Brachybacterium avium TaxID=2017485 RepID=A0A220UDL5_9MICO|nr:hypothetical protein [Brachybacterium avium]ASK66041.1 hypothetical protein CFK39_09700 [Brachybacterium avium]